MVKDVLQATESGMKTAIEAFESDLFSIRTGRASPALVERLPVEYYGTATPLNQLATISAPEPQMLMIRPYDPNSIKDIERAIMASDLSLTPNTDGQIIRLVIPSLTEERRMELVKMVNRRAEESKVALRNHRREGLEDLRELEKESIISEDEFYRARDDLQDLTDRYIDRVDEIQKRKEKEITEI